MLSNQIQMVFVTVICLVQITQHLKTGMPPTEMKNIYVNSREFTMNVRQGKALHIQQLPVTLPLPLPDRSSLGQELMLK